MMNSYDSVLDGRIGFGAWQLGNGAFFSPMSEDEGVLLVRTAIEKGVRFFDTAPGYAGGNSERILGKAIRDYREKVFISSKFGHNADGTSDFRYQMMEKSVRDSLERLQTSYLDSLLLHNPAFDILEGKSDHFQEMARLKKAGLIHHYGVSIDTYDELKATLLNTDVDVIELLFNVFSQATIPLFDEIQKRKILLIIKVPLDSGWLSGKYDENSVFTGIRNRWTKAEIVRRGTLVRQMKTIVDDENLTKYALSFILSFKAVSVIIPGTRSLQDLNDNLLASKFSLHPDLRQKLIELYQSEIKDNPLPW